MPSFYHQTTGFRLDGPVQTSMNNVWSLVQKQAGGDIHDPTAPTRLSEHRQVLHSLATQDFSSQADEARAMTLHGNIHGQDNMPPPMDNAIDENRPRTQQENHHHDASFGVDPQALQLPFHLRPPTSMQPTYPVRPDHPLQQPLAQQPATAQLTPAQLQQLRYVMSACDAHLAQRSFAPQQSAGSLAVGIAPVPYSLFPQKQLVGTHKTGGPSRRQTACRTGDAKPAAKSAARKKIAPAKYPGLMAEGPCMMGGNCIHLNGNNLNGKKNDWAEHFKAAHPDCCDGKQNVCRWSPGCGHRVETAVALALHVMKDHLGVKYLCRCGERFVNSYTLGRHIDALGAMHGYAGQTNIPAMGAGPST